MTMIFLDLFAPHRCIETCSIMITIWIVFLACLMTVYVFISFFLFVCFGFWLFLPLSSIHGFVFFYVFILYIILFDFVYVCMYVLPMYF